MKIIKKLSMLLLVIVAICLLTTTAYATTYSTGSKSFGSNNDILQGLIKFRMAAAMDYSSNTTSSIYVNFLTASVVNESSSSAVTGVIFKLYNTVYGTSDSYNSGSYTYPFNEPLEVNQSAIATRYYNTTVKKGSSEPCVVAEVTVTTPWDMGGGYTIYVNKSTITHLP